MEHKQDNIKEKPTWEKNFDNELQRLSEKVRPRILQPELVRPLNVKDVTPVLAVAEVALTTNEKGLDLSPLLVGPDTAKTQDTVMAGKIVESAYSASFTDGRAIRLDFNGSISIIPKIQVFEDKQTHSMNVTALDNSGVAIEGYVIKASGATFSFDALRAHTNVAGGVVSQREQFGMGRVIDGRRGEGQYRDLMEERDFLLRYLNLGARVDTPILLAKLDEYMARKTSGILALAYRTPFNFQHFLRVPNRDYDQAKYLIMHGINVWKREGLIDQNDLKPIFLSDAIGRNQRLEQINKLVRFYIKNGSRIAGEDLAKIHQIRSLGNRNPQNMGNDFGHRDVSDFAPPHPFDKVLPSNKYYDVHDDLSLVRSVIDRLKPESGQELFTIATEEYLKAYFMNNLGMTPREFGINLLKDVVKNVGIVDQTQVEMIKTYRKLAKEGFFKNMNKK